MLANRVLVAVINAGANAAAAAVVAAALYGGLREVGGGLRGGLGSVGAGHRDGTCTLGREVGGGLSSAGREFLWGPVTRSPLRAPLETLLGCALAAFLVRVAWRSFRGGSSSGPAGQRL